MILELTDEEILDFLMTSDFEEDYKPEELKYLLVKFRYFHRVLNGKFDLLKVDTENQINNAISTIEDKNKKIEELLIKNALLSDSIQELKGRKLTLKERISGKIIYNNED